MTVLAVITAVAVPTYISSHKAAVVESKASQLLSVLEVGQSESLRRHRNIYVHYVPVTETDNGCIGLSEKSDVETFSCSDSEGLQKIILEKGAKVNIQEPALTDPAKLFYFSPLSGMPSNDKTVKLAHGEETGKESGIMIRRYMGLKGCSNTTVTGWESCPT
ncbi:hypothetical protein VHA_003558 [Grimontia hollisae CIP 101886]|uniref:Uncharacterized protein n=1 Tax=Grimontia hollisae CIP 101886 TaxID=675812 RepID=D0ICS9_GRIHO|nr:hypothetical protein VHA_003558 [Grimontia hollisae CIP 101886]